MKGRKPIPKGIRGLQDGSTAVVATSLPICPSWLSDAAKEHWDTLVEPMAKAGICQALDAMALAVLAENLATWATCLAEVEKEGLIIQTDNGHDVINKYLKLQRQCETVIIKLLTEFGLKIGRASCRERV